MKISVRMSYKTIISLPDSYEKFSVLESKLLKLQFHGNDFFQALDEYKRLQKLYPRIIKDGKIIHDNAAH